MKMLKKLALVSAVSMISAGAFAMEAMDDASMAATTGQDGITVKIKPPTAAFGGVFVSGGNPTGFAGVLSIDNIYIHDKGGLTSTGALGDVGYTGTSATSGAITLTGFKLAGNEAIKLDIDADGGAAGAAPVLNVKVTLPSTLVIRTGDIGVAGSKRGVAAVSTDRGIVAGSNVVILSSFDVQLGSGAAGSGTGAAMNIQLGNSPQGAMIKMDGTINGGLVISGLQLNDTSGSAGTASDLGSGTGGVRIEKMTVTDVGSVTGGVYTTGTALTLATDIDISDNGLVLKMRTGSAKTDILMENIRLGAYGGTAAAPTAVTAASIGDVEVVGLDMARTQIAVMGH